MIYSVLSAKLKPLLSFSFFLLSFLFTSAKAQILINEIMPANSSDFLDPTNNYGGWVEFYNSGETALSLQGCYLSDDPLHPKKYCIPAGNTEIPAKGYLVYWFDHNDLLNTQANFKPDCGGGELVLSDPHGAVVTSLSSPEQILHTSYARLSERSNDWGFCVNPTPGKSNIGSTFSFERCPQPEFSLKGGLYSNAVSVRITCPYGMEIRYTTDGSEPSENSPQWSGSKNFSKTTILRARIMCKGYIPGSVVTQSYIITDREITLPVVSVVTDPKNLWDDEIGIYCEGTNGIPGKCTDRPVNWNCDWSRSANVELIDDSEQVFSQECDISIGGQCSRRWPMKTLKLNAEKKYNGQNHFLYPFFRAKPGLRYKSLYLRNSGDDSQTTTMRDGMLQSIIEGVLDLEHQAYQPTVHYINGEYYGIINLRERNNHNYVYSNLGYDKDSIDLLFGAGAASCGSGETFIELVSQSVNADNVSVYEDITQKVDIDELIAYMVTEMYVANWDWPNNNIKFFRNRNGGKWRWVLFDLDGGFGTININPFEGDRNNNITNCSNVLFVKFFNNLLRNEQFKQRFIDYFTICLGSVFREKRVNAIIDSISGRIRPEIPYHQQRWNNVYAFESSIDHFKLFAAERSEVLLKQMKDFFKLDDPIPLAIKSNVSHATLLMNDIKIPLNAMDGCTFKGNILKLKAIAPIGYKFDRWCLMASDGSDTSVELSTQDEVMLTAWNALNVQAEFSKEDESVLYPAVRINEVSASNDIQMNEYYKKEDWVELYNTTDTPISLAGLYMSIDPENLMQYRIPDVPEDVTRIPPHGYRILWADKMEDLTQLHLPFKLPSEGAVLHLSCFKEDENGGQVLVWKDRFTYTPHTAVQTFGRYPDGSDSTYVMNRNTFTASNFFSLYNVSMPDPITSVEQVFGTGDNGIALYYDAYSATLVVDMQQECPHEQSLVVYSLPGRSEASYRMPAYQTHYTVDLGELSDGYYIAVLYLENGKKEVFKFVK